MPGKGKGDQSKDDEPSIVKEQGDAKWLSQAEGGVHGSQAITLPRYLSLCNLRFHILQSPL